MAAEAKTSAGLIEKFGYEHFMSHLLHGYIFGNGQNRLESDGNIIYLPRDITHLITLYAPMIDKIFMEVIESMDKKIDILANMLERKQESLIEALYGIDSITMAEEHSTQGWSVETTANWVQSLGPKFKSAANTFRQYGVDGKDLHTLNEQQLRSMKITNQFIISKLLRSVHY